MANSKPIVDYLPAEAPVAARKAALGLPPARAANRHLTSAYRHASAGRGELAADQIRHAEAARDILLAIVQAVQDAIAAAQNDLADVLPDPEPKRSGRRGRQVRSHAPSETPDGNNDDE